MRRGDGLPEPGGTSKADTIYNNGSYMRWHTGWWQCISQILTFVTPALVEILTRVSTWYSPLPFSSLDTLPKRTVFVSSLVKSSTSLHIANSSVLSRNMNHLNLRHHQHPCLASSFNASMQIGDSSVKQSQHTSKLLIWKASGELQFRIKLTETHQLRGIIK